jgi:TonB family protein
MDVAAARIGKEIAHKKLKSVMVFDFFGPDRKITPLGRRLADDFSSSLSKSGATLDVQDRSKIAGALKAHSYPIDFVNSGEMAQAFAQDIQVQASVMGALTIKNGKLHAVITAYRSDKGTSIGEAEVEFPISEGDKKMLAIDYGGWIEPGDLSQYPSGGKDGYTFPVCVSCPRASYTDAAMKRRIKGTVELLVVVGEDGQVHDVEVVKPLPFGLSEAAVAAVRKWRLKPANGPNGQPVAVRQIITVSFDLI